MRASNWLSVTALGVGMVFASTAHAADSYSLGSIQGQNGWSGGTVPIVSTIDQGVTTAAAHTGTQSWRMSNSTVAGFPPGSFGIFGGFPFGPGLSVNAGQPSSGAGADTFEASLWFKAVSTSTAGDGTFLQIDFGDSTGSDRTNFFGIANLADAAGAGLRLRAAESVNNATQFLPTVTLASNLDRTVWHQIVIAGHFLNGNGNDYFTVDLDGTPLTNPASTSVSPNGGTTHLFTFEGFQNFNALTYLLTNRMYFLAQASGSTVGGAYSNTDPQGYYFDDLTYRVFNSSDPLTTLASFDSNSFEYVPEPAACATMLLGAATLLARRRSRG